MILREPWEGGTTQRSSFMFVMVFLRTKVPAKIPAHAHSGSAWLLHHENVFKCFFYNRYTFAATLVENPPEPMLTPEQVAPTASR